MAFTEVGGGSQRAAGTGSSVASATVAFPGNVTAGSLLIVAGASWQGGSGNTSVAVTDTIGTSYTVLFGATGVGYGGGVTSGFLAYGIAPSSGANTVTVDPDGSGNFIRWGIDEFSGTSPALDVDDGETTGTSTAGGVMASSITTVTDNDLIIGTLTSSTGPFTEPASYTLIAEDDGATVQAFSTVFRIVTTAGAYAADWTGPGTTAYAILLAAFKESAAAPAGVEFIGSMPIPRPMTRNIAY